MDESSVDVSASAQQRNAEVEELAADALRHLVWLRGAGVRELPPPPTMEQLARPGKSRPGEVASDATSLAQPAERFPAGEASLGPGPAGAVGPGTGAPAGRYAGDKGCGSPALVAIRQELGDCTRCKLAPGRHQLVFGVGNPTAELVFVGEGPGEDEDRQGEPFVGRAGQLLTRMIEAMGYTRGDVYIANVVKCRPPGNRNPEPDEIEACEPFLRAQLAALRPRVIVALGKFAAQTLLRESTPISRLRGRWAAYQGVKLMPTFHPAYLLRSPDEKKKAWEDLQLVMKELGKPLPRR
jgi:DNA polymerase